MILRLAAFAACVIGVAAASPALAGTPLSLDDAFQRVDVIHPELRLFGSRRQQLDAERAQAVLRPALSAGLAVDNALGSGEARGFAGAELTLSLASVFERGGKLDARRVLAESRIDALAVEREGRRLDLLAEVARRYLDVVASRQAATLAGLDIAQRKRSLTAAQRRHSAGASPESVVLAAQVALARAELDEARSGQRQQAGRQHLAALWGERAPDFDIVAGDPLLLPSLADFADLAGLLERTPELEQFVGEQRIREARLQLARSEATPDATWQLGVRRLQQGSDVGLIGSVSIPLGSRQRAAPAIAAADAELAGLSVEREVRQLSLFSTLADAHGRYRSAQLEVQRLRDDVLPLLARAIAASERAYAAGATSYLELAQLQLEQTTARRQQLDVAVDAQRALIEIQRLTGEAFITSARAPAQNGAFR